jgi:CMP-N,N'-diacetyllegionaminic acid synthase
MTSKIKAIIPVRSGSKRVPNKNLKPFAGITLLEHKISQLIRIPELEGVCVSSNDEIMLNLAKSCGAEVHHRDQYYASDSIPMSEVYANIVSEMDCQDVLYATVTTPLIQIDTYRKAIDLYYTNKQKYDSLHTVADVKDFLIKDDVPLNYNPEKFPRSQDLPNIMKLVFGFSILPRQIMIHKKSSLGYTPQYLKIEQFEALDIDTPVDFFCADALYKQLILQGKELWEGGKFASVLS